jgi:hypothetical protein
LGAIWEYVNMRSKALQFKQKANNWIERQQNNIKNVIDIQQSFVKLVLIFNLLMLTGEFQKPNESLVEQPEYD